MKLTLLFASLFLSISLRAQWLVSTPSIPDTLCALGIGPVDENIAWALGIKFFVDTSGYTFAGSEKGYFFKTTDGGQNWTGAVMPFPGVPYFSNIFAKDINTAWISGIDYDTYVSYIYKTTDGGQNWTPELADAFIKPTSFVDFIYFFDDQYGIAMGDPAASDTDTTLHFEIYLTDNGGQNWHRVESQHIPLPQPGDYGIGGLFDVVDDHIWFGTGMGGVYRSKNRGADWEYFQTPLPVVSGLSFADSLYGVASTYDGATQFLSLTTDGGETWVDINLDNSIPLLSSMTMVPVTRYIVLVTNEDFISGPFRTLISKDLGETWLQIGEGENVAWADFISPTVGYGGEFQPDDHLMRLYSYKSDPLSGILSGHELSAEISTYPNPTSDLLLVNAKTAQPADFLLLLNDADGRLVKRETFAKTASWNTSIDLHSLTTGIYSLTVSTPEGSLTRKVVKQ